ncbi:MAG: hypothetical protein NTY19_36060 [Planctomycetota bacterium]|nr:hypothetical protein [Planctomycetota bacterium]
MPVRVTCPNCGKELKSRDDLLGKHVVCPWCNDSFRMSSAVGSEARAMPPSQDDELVEETPHASFSSILVLAEVPPPPIQAPPVMPSRSEAPNDSLGAVRRGPTAASPKIKRRTPPVDRRAQTAKFITAEAVDTRIPLGADGQLPRLILLDGHSQPVVDAPAQSSNLFVLVGVLCLSVTLSVVMLFMELENTISNSAAKQRARDRIALHYLGQPPTIKPYQKKLREALQAANNEDYKKESRLYHDVLDILRVETTARSHAGLTGLREAQDPREPSDRDLEQQLSTLLGDDLSRD